MEGIECAWSDSRHVTSCLCCKWVLSSHWSTAGPGGSGVGGDGAWGRGGCLIGRCWSMVLVVRPTSCIHVKLRPGPTRQGHRVMHKPPYKSQATPCGPAHGPHRWGHGCAASTHTERVDAGDRGLPLTDTSYLSHITSAPSLDRRGAR